MARTLEAARQLLAAVPALALGGKHTPQVTVEEGRFHLRRERLDFAKLSHKLQQPRAAHRVPQTGIRPLSQAVRVYVRDPKTKDAQA